jgi:hypothetical protein
MANVWQDASYFIWGLKYKYLRIRPYKIDNTIDNLEETNWAASPSGMYVSAVPSESAVGFYQSQGFEPTDTPIPTLFELEPEDIHMVKVFETG